MANVRVQVDFDDRRIKELDALMETCGIATRKELLNNALTLFEWAVQQVLQGRMIASVNEAEQKYRELQMPVLSAAVTRARAASVQAPPATAQY